jgi:hypothetical protein
MFNLVLKEEGVDSSGSERGSTGSCTNGRSNIFSLFPVSKL